MLGPQPGEAALPSATLTSPRPGHHHSLVPSVRAPGDFQGKSNNLHWMSSDCFVAGSCRRGMGTCLSWLLPGQLGNLGSLEQLGLGTRPPWRQQPAGLGPAGSERWLGAC